MKNIVGLVLFGFAFAAAAADLVLIGDSTLAPRPGENYSPPSGSWGDALTNHFVSGASCRNYAVGGRTVVTTLPTWEKSLQGMHTGDFVIVQFGINDAAKKKFVDEAKFKEILGKFVDDIRARGANPVLCGPIADAGYRKNAKADAPFEINTSRNTYCEYTRAVAAAKKADFVDMTALTAAENTRLGKDGAHALYRGTWERPDEKTGTKRPVFDTTHPNKARARRFAEIFIAEVKSRKLPIAQLFRH